MFSNRWDDFDTSPVQWHIDKTAGVKDGPESYGSTSDYIVNPEPWQSAVNGIY
jgi:hypothetical protein